MRSIFRAHRTKHRRTSLLAIVLLILGLHLQVSAQNFATVFGRVTDDILHQPIAGVVVTVLPDGTSTVTDYDGRYRLERIMPGTITLQLNSAFHVKRQTNATLVREGETASIDIALHPITVRSTSQTVTAKRDIQTGTTQYDTTQIRASSRVDVGGFLDEQGYLIQSDGRAKYLSLAGLTPQRTLVLLDGVPLNPNGNAADLATIPLTSVDKIEVYSSGAASRFGEGALGGAVNIVSKQPTRDEPSKLSATGTFGSYALNRELINTSQTIVGGMQLLADYEYSFSRNNFEYAHPYLGDQQRANNASRQASYFATLSINRVKPLTVTARHYDGYHGIPGAVLQETPGATATHSSTQLGAAYRTSTVSANAAYRELTQNYRDALGTITYDRHYLQVARQFDATRTWSIAHRLDFDLGGQYLSENFFNDDRLQPESSLPAIKRRTSAAFTRVGYQQSMTFAAINYGLAYRIDRVDNRNYRSPHVSLAISSERILDLEVSANYAESFRLPPIDALFWSSDVFAIGNPDLQPERARLRDIQLRAEIGDRIRATGQVRHFVNDVDGMIYWRRRFDGKYTPVNLSRAQITGTEIGLSMTTFNQRLSAQFHHTIQNSINLSRSENYYGLVIPFQPDRTDRATIAVRFWRCKLDYTYSYTGVRYIREANTKALPAYSLHDVSLEFTTQFLGAREILTLAVYNLGNTRYEILERVPMPPRNFTTSLTVEL